MSQPLTDGQTIIVVPVDELETDNFWNVRGARMIKHLSIIFPAFQQLLCSDFMSFGVKTLEFLESQMHNIDIGFIRSSVDKLSLKYVPKLTDLRQNICPADKDLVQQGEVIFRTNIETG